MQSVSMLLVGLLVVGVAGMAVAVYIYLTERSRRAMVDRTLGATQAAEFRRHIRRDTTPELSAVQQRMLKAAPGFWADNIDNQRNLTQAGYDGPLAPLVYALLRVVTLVGLPLAVFAFAPVGSFFMLVLWTVAAAVTGFMLPVYFLHRGLRLRQERIRRALPDGLDLLGVCVEAGISLDAALLRVARDMTSLHPDLAGELLVVNRKTNAGMTREEALRGLYERTGVEEIRTLVASLIQSEKWGASSSRALRVSSETLRRKRRQAIERKAATAPLKMLAPLALLIFPALFIVILGPPALNIVAAFRGQ